MDQTSQFVADTTYTASVSAEQQGSRLDKFLSQAIPILSRSQVQGLLEKGHVSLDGRTILDAAYRVKHSQTYQVIVPPAAPVSMEAQDIPLSILYEDEHVIVLDKPPFLVVHPAVGNPDQTLVNALLHHCGEGLLSIGGEQRPGIVHRLDKDTSGLMVVAKTDVAHQGLSNQFANRSISRTYQALVWGVPSPSRGRIETLIGRDPRDRKKMAVVKKGGRSAMTLYHVVRVLGGILSMVECVLMTGRTHQIRVHLTSIGHPLVGDPMYGRPRLATLKGWSDRARNLVSHFPRQVLHAVSLRFIHPLTQQEMSFNSPFPPDIKDLLQVLEEEGLP